MAETGTYPVFNWGDMPNPDIPSFVPQGAAAGGGGAGNYADTFANPPARMPNMMGGPRRGQYGPQMSHMGQGSYNASMHIPRDYNLSMMQLLSALMRMRRG